MNAVASGVTIAVQLLASASIGFYCAQCDCSCRQGPFCACLRHHSLSIDGFVFDSPTPANMLPVFYVSQTVAYSLFAPIKYSVFQNAVDSSMRCSLISVQSQMVAVGPSFSSVQCCVE